MSIYDEECSAHCDDLCELIDKEIENHYNENFIEGLIKAKEIIKEYFESE